MVIAFVQDAQQSIDMPVQIGMLKKERNFPGMKLMVVGHPVFEYRDRYIVYGETLKGESVETKYYKTDVLDDARFYVPPAEWIEFM